MEDYITVSAKTLDDAITEALVQLGVTSDRLDYIVVEKGSEGFLGIGRKQAVIKARRKREEKPVEEVVKEEPKVEIKIDKAQENIVKNSDLYNKFATKLEYDSFIISYLKNDVNDIKIIIDKENVTLISSKSINLVDSQLNEFLLDYKNMIGKKMKVSICENCKEYDY